LRFDTRPAKTPRQGHFDKRIDRAVGDVFDSNYCQKSFPNKNVFVCVYGTALLPSVMVNPILKTYCDSVLLF
jgi:hypothetical protein